MGEGEGSKENRLTTTEASVSNAQTQKKPGHFRLGSAIFKTGAINRSATSPELLQFYYSLPLSQPRRPANFVLIQMLTRNDQSQYRGFQVPQRVLHR